MFRRMVAVFVLIGAFALVEAGAQCTPGGDMPKRPTPPTFGDFDLDGDGGISSEEYYAARGARMAERAIRQRAAMAELRPDLRAIKRTPLGKLPQSGHVTQGTKNEIARLLGVI